LVLEKAIESSLGYVIHSVAKIKKHTVGFIRIATTA